MINLFKSPPRWLSLCTCGGALTIKEKIPSMPFSDWQSIICILSMYLILSYPTIRWLSPWWRRISRHHCHLSPSSLSSLSSSSSSSSSSSRWLSPWWRQTSRGQQTALPRTPPTSSTGNKYKYKYKYKYKDWTKIKYR